MPVIQTSGLTKVYRTYRKERGLRGSIKGLVKRRYDETRAADQVSFNIDEGEFVGFLGPNGAGKTTVLKMLSGLLNPTSGDARVLGFVPWERRNEMKRQFSLLMGQKNALWWDLPAQESLELNRAIYGIDPVRFKKVVDGLSELLEVQDKMNVMVRELSLGERMKMELISALIHEPRVLFLDEPTSGLDPVHRQHIWNLLYDLSNEGKTIFVTTHYMDEAERCTEVGFIEGGRLLAKASPRALKSSFRTRLLEIDVDPLMPALVRLRDLPELLGVSLRSGSLRLYTPEAEQLIARWRENWPFPDIRLLGERWVQPDMEDVFTAYSQGYDGVLKRSDS